MLRRVQSVLRKPPGYVVRRVVTEIRHELDRFRVPTRGRTFDTAALLQAFNCASAAELWSRLQSRPKPAFTLATSESQYERQFPGDLRRILADADRACRHEIDLLGSGPVSLGDAIDWHRDYKTGDRWPLGYFRQIDYINRERASDVKTVWELSRMQWLIPCGQAYLLTGDERYAAAVRDVIDSWIAANPYACSVNWGVTMETAMRIFSWTWFFHVFARSKAWSEEGFRGRFLCSLYLHGEFTERFLERSDVNGNHFTADAAALVVAGVFFGPEKCAQRWFAEGCRELEKEIVLQVSPDGVDFEASVAYHRLVAELFLHASLWVDVAGAPFSATYRERLRAMGEFTVAYTRSDGSTPLWGDADDARTLPFGGQSIGDHRYLPGLIGLHLNDAGLIAKSHASRVEAYWTFGVDAAQRIPERPARGNSQAFQDGGFFVMRNDCDHVFIDCGPLGLAGRGGHGHNDLMSFEAMLDGELLIVDSGSYVYTASFEERNHFRSTAVHNTPQIDGEEINRFISKDYLWNLHNDAQPRVVEWAATPERDRIVMTHTGYLRLKNPVRPSRVIALDHTRHELIVEDSFEGAGEHELRIPLQLAPGVDANIGKPGRVLLSRGIRTFELTWRGSPDWQLRLESGRVSRSYGCVEPAVRLLWVRAGAADRTLTVQIMPRGIAA